jgi:hypothetical protein
VFEIRGSSKENAFSFTTQNGASSRMEASTKRFRTLPAALDFQHDGSRAGS